MENKVILGYWGIRGRAQISRLLLAYTDAVWEDKVYTAPEQWYGADKENLGFDFPNLPYLIEGDFKLTETVAVERYIIERSNKKDLFGKTAQDQAKVNMIISVGDDVFIAITPLLFDKDYKDKLKETFEKIKPKLDLMAKFYGDKEWAIGYLTYADFQQVEGVKFLQNVFPEEMKQYAAFQKTVDAFDKLPEIQKYYAQENAVKAPFLPI